MTITRKLCSVAVAFLAVTATLSTAPAASANEGRSDPELLAIAEQLEIEVKPGHVVTEAEIDPVTGDGYVVMDVLNPEHLEPISPGTTKTTETAAGTRIAVGVAAGCSRELNYSAPYLSGGKVHGTVSASQLSGCSSKTFCQDLGHKRAGLWWYDSQCATLSSSATSKILATSKTCKGSTNRTWGNSGVWGETTKPDFYTRLLACSV